MSLKSKGCRKEMVPLKRHGAKILEHALYKRPHFAQIGAVAILIAIVLAKIIIALVFKKTRGEEEK